MAGNEAVTGRQVGLAGLAAFLDRFLLPLVLVVAGLGVALPAPGRRLDACGAILITLAVLVFCSGSSVTFAEFKGLRAAVGADGAGAGGHDRHPAGPGLAGQQARHRARAPKGG